MPVLRPLHRVDRQSPQGFADRGGVLGGVLGAEVTLISSRLYGEAVQAPTAILRFAVPRVTLWQRITVRGLARFEAGDLIGIQPEEGGVPRLDSLAAGRRDGFVEIVVRRQSGGLCAGQLITPPPGQSIAAFCRPNPGFTRPGGARP